MDTIVLYGAAFVALLVSFVNDRNKTAKALKKAWKAFEGILPQFLVVLLLVALAFSLLDTRTIGHYLGEESGFWGVLGAAVIGAVTLIPGFVAFPIAASLLSQGAGATQIAAFISSLMMVGVVTLPLEMRYFGRKLALLRNAMAFLFSFVVAVVVGQVVAL
jgi:uncharacterized membrane protein YraQ (UPF0718 family)